MSEWQKVKLSEVLTHKKASIKIDDDTEYKLCRVRLHRRGVLLRGKQFGHEIKTKKQQVCKSGDLIVAEMDAKFGGYGFIPDELEGAIVSSHYYLYELDKNKISQNYFETLISTDYIQNQIEAKGSTNYSSIRAKEFLEYEIPLANQELQTEISKRFLTFSDFTSKLNFEHKNQQTYLTQLRQAILQEAIEGKLTADWRVKNSVQKGDPNTDATALLEQIKAEKQRLIADGKIKKGKPLAPIKPEDVPFELPAGWVWVKLGEIALNFDYGTSSKSSKQGKISVLRMGNIQNGLIDWNDLVYTDDDEEIFKYNLLKFDLLFNRTNSKELVGKTALFDSDKKAIHAGYLVRFRMFGKISPFFANYLMNSCFHREWCNEVKTDALGQSNINATKLKDFLFPLPPLSEQNAIVERVDRLLNHVNALETQVTERKDYAQQLMQAVLREAFAG